MKILNRILMTLIIYGILTASAHANPERQRRSRSAQMHELGFESYTFKSVNDATQTTLRVYVNFSNDILQFVKESNFRFHARYELLISIMDENGDQVAGKTLTDDVFVKSFAATNRRSLSNIIEFVTDLRPGDYKMMLELNDMDTQQSVKQRRDIVIPDYNKSSILLSDVVFSDSLDTDTLSSENIKPNIHANFSNPESPFGMFFYIYPNKSDEPITVTYEIKSVELDAPIVTNSETISPSKESAIPYIINLKNKISRVMKYSMIIQADQGEDRAEVELTFLTSWNYLDVASLTVDQSIAPMEHLVNSREWKWVQNASDSAKDVWFRNYWKQRDPTPDSPQNELKEEYFKRVAFVAKNYTVPNRDKPGWTTDRGRIYLKYGKPSNIERRASGFNTPSYEIWYYKSIERRYIFEDRSGFGDYQLIKVE